MTKTKVSANVLKSTMIGAVALTPVLAIGLNAETVDAATKTDVNTLIDDLNLAFDNLADYDGPELNGENAQALLHSAHGKIVGKLDEGKWKTHLGKMLKDDVTGDRRTLAEGIVEDLVYLLANSSTGYELGTHYNEFYNSLNNSDLRTAFGNNKIDKDLFIDFLVAVQNEVLQNLNGNDSYQSKFFNALDKVIDETKYVNLKAGIKGTVNIVEVGLAVESVVSSAEVSANEKRAFVALAKEYKKIVDAKPKPPVEPQPPIIGGGGVVTPPTTGEGAVEVDGSAIVSNPQATIDAIEKAAKVEELVVKVQAGSKNMEIPATILSALDKKNSDAVVVLQFGDVAYELPVNAFDLTEIAKDLDVASAELKLNVTVEKVDNPLAGKEGYKVLADAFDFNVTVVAPGGKSQTLNVFPTPIKRSVPTTNELNPLTTVGVTVDAKGNVTAVPTYVTEGKKSANLYRSTNSVYTLIEYSKSFTDITAGTSWAEEYVDKLASRMVVNGVTATEYAPTKMITRGEFAAILSRGLGIVAMDKTANVFADVSSSQAFNKNGEIAAVVEAGIVAGFTDGTFRPYEEITRDQAAIMISRAIDYVGADKVTFDKKKALTAFKDNKDIGAASRKHVERVYQAGLLDGYLDDTFRPNADANRAQMAKIIYNFLAEIKFIN